jgi:hypothetical protein
MILFALDPGLTRSGVALFQDGRLIRAGVIDSKVKGEVAVRCDYISQRAMGILEELTYSDLEGSEFAGEWPQIYRGEKNVKNADPNDMLPLCGIVMAVGSVMRAVYGTELTTYLPKQWTGSVSKDETVKGAKTSPRALKIKRRLDAAELKVWKGVKYHDTIDAIGIGLHHLGRMKRIRVFPRS